jgi:hypothetical protein
MNTKAVAAFAALFALAGHGAAQAGQITFNERTCQSASMTGCSVKADGVSYSTNLSGWSAAKNANFSSASIAYYGGGGLGITTKGETLASPQHATDNSGSTEAFLINFGTLSLALNQVSIGWYSGDADISILRYTGVNPPVLGNSTVANLDAADGWEFIGDFASLKPSSPLNFNTGNDAKTASWWLVSAYNSGYSGKSPVPGLSNGDDYFKLSGFGAMVVDKVPPSNDVPEPGSFALFGIAMLGFAVVRAKSKAK